VKSVELASCPDAREVGHTDNESLEVFDLMRQSGHDDMSISSVTVFFPG
jgi:hypothetical protein